MLIYQRVLINKMSQFYYEDSDMQFTSKPVLCVEEYDHVHLGRKKGNVDMRMFIYFDDETEHYVVYGRRNEKKKSLPKYVPFRFEATKMRSMIEFMMYSMDRDSRCSTTLYNFNNMMEEDVELCYEFFEDNMSSSYEIVGYDDEQICYKTFERSLKIVRDLKN